MEEGIRIMDSTINHHNSSLYFIKEELMNHIGIIVDNECNNVQDLLEQVSYQNITYLKMYYFLKFHHKFYRK